MSASPEPSPPSSTDDPLRQAVPGVDDVDARRARASIESRLFSGPPQPVRVGRYRIEGRVGAGGMGVVYRAHDPELARDVAVKLMNTDIAGGKDPSTARARLVREARAMAQLAHPNVIHVYDVGTTEDGVFIAMELVEGHSLAHRFEQRSMPWREILRYYVDAGRGLAAAHDAGIIHRDFKPENVLLGEDGRVRVGDFGLAGGPSAIEGPSSDSQLDQQSDDLLGPSGSLTKTGALLGTPKYMAPEQETGGLVGARSDQFSFCVALYEALYGYPPFAGNSVAEYRRNVHHGRVLDPPADRRVRGWVHAGIVRGLAVDPNERHSELHPLLDRLEEALLDPNIARRRRRRNRTIAGFGGAGGLLVALATGLLMLRPNDDPATAPAERPGASSSATPTLNAPAAGLGSPSGATESPSSAPAVGNSSVLAPNPATARPVEPDPTGRPSPSPPDRSPDRAPSGPAAGSSDPPSADAKAHVRAASKRRPRTETCYFQHDKFNYLQRRRRHTRFVTGADGHCYDCQDEAPDYRRAQLNPSDCARYHLCVRAGEDQCSS